MKREFATYIVRLYNDLGSADATAEAIAEAILYVASNYTGDKGNAEAFVSTIIDKLSEKEY